MSLYGAFDRTKHFDELDDPLVTNEGVLTPAQRRARVVANLFVDGDTVDFDADMTFDGTIEQTHVIDSDTVGLDLNYTSTDTTGNQHGLHQTMDISGAGATGGRALFETNITGALGGWSNALKGIVNYGTGGSTSGLGSAIVAEMVMGPDTSAGTYAPLEIEFGFPADSVAPDATSAFINMTAYGNSTELAAFNADGALVDIGGITAGSGDIFQTSAVTGVNSTHALRIRIGGTAYYLPLHTAAAFA